LCGGAWLLLSGMGDGFAQSAVTQPRAEIPALQIISRVVRTNRPGFLSAIYAEPKGVRLFGFHSVSDDNGRGWSPLVWQPDFTANLPHGYRREPVTAVLDPHTSNRPLRRKLIICVIVSPPTADAPGASKNPSFKRATTTRSIRWRACGWGRMPSISATSESSILQRMNRRHFLTGLGAGSFGNHLRRSA